MFDAFPLECMSCRQSATIFITAMSIIVGAVDYCQLHCDNTNDRHVLCKYDSAGNRCVNLKTTSSYRWRCKLTKWHNKLRNSFANRELTIQIFRNLPQASDMNELVWDNELETIAHRMNIQCDLKAEDRCYRTQNFDRLLLLESYTTSPWQNVETIFINIVNQMKLLTEDDVVNFRKTNRTYGLSAVLGAETTVLGCSEARFTLPVGQGRAEETRVSRLICLYGPSKPDGKPLYTPGMPCSKCPVGRRSGKFYRHLCSSGVLLGRASPVCLLFFVFLIEAMPF